ncbi:PorP/SprF family type IX secretion system membrane protein [Chitinophaga nivalis]|uniref:Type IX secretion system membrane protein PorP/SprF n=1 Tax=Chitinophaga nivalis TaxID=2991709 RepID=A0ABT3IFI8_9BACT|nr:type IX secretion system membrane protein PorP/SprF [Chitinophaga nivalis]MCW3467597.1 type IX secretion system membrane protein PorP/SprF [Chitinophaga nivalis]MCW3482711.1 type IX secretion system membrane protein PorP/SprF [Chitinophaga nivalis]
MKKIVLTGWVVLMALWTHAQQQPHYTQYIMNPFIINPAVAGIENYWDLRLSHRHQWVGMKGAPVTTYLTLHGPLRKSEYAAASPTGFDPQGENPRGKAYWRDYTTPPPHPGVGLTVLNDRTGPLNRFSITGAYAHHINLSPTTSISAGISVGMQQISLDASKVEFFDPADPVLGSSGGVLNKWRPEVNAGLWLYGADYFAGLSAQNIIPQKIGFDNGKVIGDSVLKGKLIPHIFFTTGYRLWINDDLNVMPSVMLKFITAKPLSVDVNAKMMYRDRFWVGASYRLNDGIAGMFGVNINSMINIGYSYDYTTSSLNTVTKGSHEIMIGFLLGNKFGDTCPRNVW